MMQLATYTNHQFMCVDSAGVVLGWMHHVPTAGVEEYLSLQICKWLSIKRLVSSPPLKTTNTTNL
jgi:hypothetical protein